MRRPGAGATRLSWPSSPTLGAGRAGRAATTVAAAPLGAALADDDKATARLPGGGGSAFEHATSSGSASSVKVKPKRAFMPPAHATPGPNAARKRTYPGRKLSFLGSNRRGSR